MPLFIILLSVVVLTILFFIFKYFTRKWVCKEGSCELTLFGGKYDSKQNCENACNKEKFKESTFTCDPDYNCKKVSSDKKGEYTSMDACLKNCKSLEKIIVEKPVIINRGRGWGWRGRPWHRRRWW
jgi:hypothetical protein